MCNHESFILAHRHHACDVTEISRDSLNLMGADICSVYDRDRASVASDSYQLAVWFSVFRVVRPSGVREIDEHAWFSGLLDVEIVCLCESVEFVSLEPVLGGTHELALDDCHAIAVDRRRRQHVYA